MGAGAGAGAGAHFLTIYKGGARKKKKKKKRTKHTSSIFERPRQLWGEVLLKTKKQQQKKKCREKNIPGTFSKNWSRNPIRLACF